MPPKSSPSRRESDVCLSACGLGCAAVKIEQRANRRVLSGKARKEKNMSRRQKRRWSEDDPPKMANCPTCDCAPRWSCEFGLGDGVMSYRVGCPSCGASVGERAGLEEAVAAWNEDVRLIEEDMSTLRELKQKGCKMGGINILEVSEATKMLERKQRDWMKCRDVGVNQDIVCLRMEEFLMVLDVMKKVRRTF